MSHERREGLTLVELSVTLVLSSILFYAIAMAVRTTGDLYEASTTRMDLDARGQRAMNRMLDALRGTRFASVAGLPPAPLSSGTVQFTKVDAFDGSKASITAPQQVTLAAEDVLWIENPALADERRAPWASGIPALFAGEVLNGLDDNGNGLNDEPGLYFVRRGRVLEVGLTVEDDGLVRSWTGRVACRN